MAVHAPAQATVYLRCRAQARTAQHVLDVAAAQASPVTHQAAPTCAHAHTYIIPLWPALHRYNTMTP
ncbi:hypothetical protein ABBQ38_013275 [Trebouxia sp. C0009 RCD-2024]